MACQLTLREYAHPTRSHRVNMAHARVRNGGRQRRATRSRSSAARRSKTSCHWPSFCWRNRRMVGYQGLSWRSMNQRQSPWAERATHTCAPNAPARWATAVSVVMTRSRFLITAARSMKAPAASSSSEIDDLKVAMCNFLGSGPVLQADQPHVLDRGHRGDVREGEGTLRVEQVFGIAAPTDSHAKGVIVRQLGAPLCNKPRVGSQVWPAGQLGHREP
jgi:hypothetical protein